MAERPGPKPSLGVTLLASTALVVPFLALELIARRACAEDFPTVLFAFMSIHAFLIVVTLGPTLRQLCAERGISNLGGWPDHRHPARAGLCQWTDRSVAVLHGSPKLRLIHRLNQPATEWRDG